MRGVPLTREQRSLVIGSLLGDGTLLKTTSGWCYRVHHGLAQRRLVETKFRVMEAYVRTRPRESGRGLYFRTISHPAFEDLRKQFYSGVRKVVPLPLLERELDAYGFAVWIMDDGSAEGRQLRLNTQCFTFEENVALAGVLRASFGIEFRVNSDKGRPRLRCCASSMDRLVSLVRPHTIPDMLYKLSL